MPHCIIEHSANFNGSELIPLVHRGAIHSNLFDATSSDIKVRSIPYTEYKTGNEELNFVHVTVKILSGRSLEQRSHLSYLMLEELKKEVTKNCSLSVEVVEMERESYAKAVV